MAESSRIEAELLGLPESERFRIVVRAWDSLRDAPIDDPDGLRLALQRDAEIESGAVQPISHHEFLRRTEKD